MASTSEDPRTVVDLVRELAGETKTLLQHEVELLRSEVAAKAESAKVALLAALSGLALMFSGVLILLLGAVFGLGESMPMWCAALIVGVIAGVSGVFLLKAGIPDDGIPDDVEKSLEKSGVEKSETEESVRESAHAIKEQLS